MRYILLKKTLQPHIHFAALCSKEKNISDIREFWNPRCTSCKMSVIVQAYEFRIELYSLNNNNNNNQNAQTVI